MIRKGETILIFGYTRYSKILKNALSSTGEKLTGDQCQERFDGGKSVSKGPIFVQRGVVSSKKKVTLLLLLNV